MKTIVLGLFAASLLGSAAIAAPLNPTAPGPTEAFLWNGAGPARLQRVRPLFPAPRSALRSTLLRRRRRLRRAPQLRLLRRTGYYDRGYGYYGGGPSIGFSFGTRSW